MFAWILFWELGQLLLIRAESAVSSSRWVGYNIRTHPTNSCHQRAENPTLRTCRGREPSYTWEGGRLLHLFPITFPHIPMPPTALLLYSVSHKYPELLAFREAGLRFVFPSPHLAALQVNPLFAADLGVSAFGLAVGQAKRMWFDNNSHKITCWDCTESMAQFWRGQTF